MTLKTPSLSKLNTKKFKPSFRLIKATLTTILYQVSILHTKDILEETLRGLELSTLATVAYFRRIILNSEGYWNFKVPNQLPSPKPNLVSTPQIKTSGIGPSHPWDSDKKCESSTFLLTVKYYFWDICFGVKFAACRPHCTS